MPKLENAHTHFILMSAVLYCPYKDKVRMCILQFCYFTIKYTEMCSNLIFLNKIAALINALMYKVCMCKDCRFIQKYQIATHFSMLYCKIAKL